MNWIGGARKRVRFQNNTKLQKEFFERKRLGFHIKRKKVVDRTPAQRKHGVSQDLLALQIVSKTGSDPASERPVKKVDMSKFQSCSQRVQDVELGPLSPVTAPSKLNLQETKQTSDFTSGLGSFCKSRTTTADANKKKENSMWQRAFTSDKFESHTSHNNSFIASMGPLLKPKENINKSIGSSNNTPVKLKKQTLDENLGKRQRLDLFTLEDFQITPLLKYEKPVHSPGHILCQARTSTPKDLLFASESISSIICRDSSMFQNGQSQFRTSTNRAMDQGVQKITSQDDGFRFIQSECQTKQTKFINETNVEVDEGDINLEKEINKTRSELMNERKFRKTEKYRDNLDGDFQFSSPYVLYKGMSWGETEKTFPESYGQKESDSKIFARTDEHLRIRHSNIATSGGPLYVSESKGSSVSDSSHSSKNSLLIDDRKSANLHASETSKHNIFNMKTKHFNNIWTERSARKKPFEEIYELENMSPPQMHGIKFLKGAQIVDMKEKKVHEYEHNGKENCDEHVKNTEEMDEVFHIFQYPSFPIGEENIEDDKERKSSSPKPGKEFPQSLAIDHDDAADKLADEAEEKDTVTLMSQSNGLEGKEKEEQVKGLELQLEEKIQQLKSNYFKSYSPSTYTASHSLFIPRQKEADRWVAYKMVAANTLSDRPEAMELNKSAVYNADHLHSAKKIKLELWCSPTVTITDYDNKESSLTQERHLKQIGEVVKEVCQLDDQDMCDDLFSQDNDTAKQDADLDEADIYMISLGYDQVENTPLPEDGKTSADATSETNNQSSSANKYIMSHEGLSTTEVHEDIKMKEDAGNTDRLHGSARVPLKPCEKSIYNDQNGGRLDTEMVKIPHQNMFNQCEMPDEQLKFQTSEGNQDSLQNPSSYGKLDERVNQISKADENKIHKSTKHEQLDDKADSGVSYANQNHMKSENEVHNKKCKVFTTTSCGKTDDFAFCEGLSRPNLSREEAGQDFTKDVILSDGVSTKYGLFDEKHDQSKRSYTDTATSPIVMEKISRSAQCSPELTDKYTVIPMVPRLVALSQKTLSVKPISYYYRQLAIKDKKHVSCQTESLNTEQFELSSSEMLTKTSIQIQPGIGYSLRSVKAFH